MSEISIYVKNNGKTCGYLFARSNPYADEKKVDIGWCYLHPIDQANKEVKFDKIQARNRAMGRALLSHSDRRNMKFARIPKNLQDEFRAFIHRCQIYFQDAKLPNWTMRYQMSEQALNTIKAAKEEKRKAQYVDTVNKIVAENKQVLEEQISTAIGQKVEITGIDVDGNIQANPVPDESALEPETSEPESEEEPEPEPVVPNKTKNPTKFLFEILTSYETGTTLICVSPEIYFKDHGYTPTSLGERELVELDTLFDGDTDFSRITDTNIVYKGELDKDALENVLISKGLIKSTEFSTFIND